MLIKRIEFKSILKDNKGFTLVEVLAAVTLMTVSLLMIVQLLSYSMSWNSESGNITVAKNLAQEKIEEYRNNKYTVGETVAVVTDFPKYRRGVQVLADPTAGITTVKVTVTWTAKNGSSKSVELHTVISN